MDQDPTDDAMRALIEGARLLTEAEARRDPARVERAMLRFQEARSLPYSLWAMPLGRAHTLRYDLLDHDEDVDVAADLLLAIRDRPEATATAESVAALAFGLRFERRGRLPDLHRAVELSRQCLDRTPRNTPQFTGRTGNLCRWLRQLAEHDPVGPASALRETMAAASAALEHAGPGDSSRPGLLAALGMALGTWVQRGLGNDLRPAIQVLDEALRSADEPGLRLSILQQVGGYEVFQAMRTRDAALVAAGARHLEEAVRRDPQARDPQGHLALAYSLQAEFTGDLTLFARAADVLETLLTRYDGDDPDRLVPVINLIDVLRQLFEQTGDRARLERGLELGRPAVASAGDEELKGAAITNLAILLNARGDADDRREDVEEALGLLREAVRMEVRPEHESALRTSLGNVLFARHRWSRDPQDLTAAIQAFEAGTAALPPGVGAPPRLAGGLGRTLVELALTHPDHAPEGTLERGVEILRAFRPSTARTGEVDPRVAAPLTAGLLALYQRTGDETLLEEADQVSGGRLSRTRPEERPGLSVQDVMDGAAALTQEARRTGRMGLLDQAVDLLRAHLGRGNGAEENARLLSELCISLRHRYLAAGDPEDLDASIAAGVEAVDLLPEESVSRAGWAVNLATALRVRFQEFGDRDDLDRAVALIRAAVPRFPSGDSRALSAQTALGNVLSVRYEHFRALDDLDGSIAAHRAAVGGFPAGSSQGRRARTNLGGQLVRRFTVVGDDAALDEAITLLREAFTSYDPQDAERATTAVNLAGALGNRWQTRSSPADLDEMVQLGRVAVGVAAGRERVESLLRLSEVLMSRFRWAEDPADLDEAIESGRAALRLARGARASAVRLELAEALRLRFEHGGTEADLAHAIRLLEEDLSDGAEAGRAPARREMGVLLATRFKSGGRPEDLDEAIGWARSALADASADSDVTLTAANDLAVTLLERYGLAGDLDDLDQALEQLDRAESARDRSDRRSSVAVNRSLVLRTRFERVGDLRDLEAAIAEAQRALAGSGPEDRVGRRGAASALGSALQTRYEWSGQLTDLEAAVAAHREAFERSGRASTEIAVNAHNLGNALRQLAERTGDLALIDESVARTRAAIAATAPDDPGLIASLGTLGNTLRLRFRRTNDGNDLNAAIAAYTEARRVGGSAAASVVANNLANALVQRFERGYALMDSATTDVLADLDEAVTAYREALAALRPDHPRRSASLSGLAGALQLRDRVTGQDGRHLGELVELYREGAELLALEPQTRVRMAMSWGRAAHHAGDAAEAARGMRLAVRLLPQMAWHGLDAATREEQLAGSSGLAADAAAAVIRADEPGAAQEAVVMLEQGRSVLWNQALSLRDGFEDLAEQAPEAAAELLRLQDELAGRTRTLPDPQDPDGLNRRWRAAREWDAAVARIQDLPGLEGRFAPAPFELLREAAAEGPVVVVNVSDLGCHALVLTAGESGATVLELPGITAEEVRGLAGALASALAGGGEENPDAVLRKVLAELWTGVVRPVLGVEVVTRALRESESRNDGVPRLWWCPTGPLGLLPLHAAGPGPGAPEGPREELAGRLVVSSTPTLAALRRGRAAQAANQERGQEPRVLLVAMPETPGQRDLPGVVQEEERLRQRLGEGVLTTLRGPTRAEVLAALPGVSWVHWACHGRQDDRDPARSGLMVQDGQITIETLTGLVQGSDGERPDLTFLSACQTAAGSSVLEDEAFHLAAAMLTIGFPHVVGTMWTIADFTAPQLADRVYRNLVRDGRLDSRGAAAALKAGVDNLRRGFPEEPRLWAPYLHYGP